MANYAARGVFAVLIASLGAMAFGEDKSAIELKKAFQQGLVQMTFTAKDGGKKVELKLKNLSSKPVTILVSKGKTPFDTYMRKFSLVAAEQKEFAVPASGEKSETFDLEQEGAGRWTSGSITLEPAKRP